MTDHALRVLNRARLGFLQPKKKPAPGYGVAAKDADTTPVIGPLGRTMRAAAQKAQKLTQGQAEELGFSRRPAPQRGAATSKKKIQENAVRARLLAKATTFEHFMSSRGAHGDEENPRTTYQQRHGAAAPNATPPTFLWAGLSAGGTADGVPFSAGRPVLRPLANAATLPNDAYARSVARFVAGCPPWLRKRMMVKVADSLAVETPKAAAAAPGMAMAPGGGGGGVLDLRQPSAAGTPPLPGPQAGMQQLPGQHMAAGAAAHHQGIQPPAAAVQYMPPAGQYAPHPGAMATAASRPAAPPLPALYAPAGGSGPLQQFPAMSQPGTQQQPQMTPQMLQALQQQLKPPGGR